MERVLKEMCLLASASARMQFHANRERNGWFKPSGNYLRTDQMATLMRNGIDGKNDAWYVVYQIDRKIKKLEREVRR